MTYGITLCGLQSAGDQHVYIMVREKHTKYTGSSPGLTANMFFENIEIIELTPILKQ